MLDFNPTFHTLIDTVAARRFCKRLDRGRRRHVLYKNHEAGSVVLAREIVRRRKYMELHILEHWPVITAGDVETAYRIACPDMVSAQQSRKQLVDNHDAFLANKTRVGENHRKWQIEARHRRGHQQCTELPYYNPPRLPGDGGTGTGKNIVIGIG